MNKDKIVYIKDLNLILCEACHGRKILKPLRDKISIDTVHVYYKMGYILRTDKGNEKIYHTEEEVKEMIYKYINN